MARISSSVEACNAPEWRYCDGLRLRLQVVDQRVEIDGAPDLVGAAEQHREVVAARRDEAVHGHAEGSARVDDAAVLADLDDLLPIRARRVPNVRQPRDLEETRKRLPEPLLLEQADDLRAREV